MSVEYHPLVVSDLNNAIFESLETFAKGLRARNIDSVSEIAKWLEQFGNPD